jgi:flagellar hook-length control protein FliK
VSLAAAAEPVAAPLETGAGTLEAKPGATPEAAAATRSETSANASSAAIDPAVRAPEPARTAEAAKPAPAAPPEPPLASERAADVLRQIKLQLTPELRQATIQLEPRELGRISIKVALRGGALRAELRAERRSTLEALERHAPELCAAIEKAGLGAPELSLELGLDRRRAPADRAPSRRSPSPAAASPAAAPALERALARRIAQDGVDTYA